jgi:hypothetical protein
MRIAIAGLMMAFALTLAISTETSVAQDKKEPKFTIKDVMKLAHGKEGLLGKVVNGEAEKQDKEELLQLYTALSQNKPPKGEAASWKAKTDPMVAAAKDVVAGKDEGIGALKKAVNCKGCHSVHRKAKGE